MQLDLNGNQLGKMQSALFLAHTLKHHKKKLYKTCGIMSCKQACANRANRKFCIDCLIDFAMANNRIDDYLGKCPFCNRHQLQEPLSASDYEHIFICETERHKELIEQLLGIP